jgi:SAM-dependent methyltransferase
MSGFDPEWLLLREPVDHRSRARGPQDACSGYFGGFEQITVLDLGAGTGSNLRASWLHLPNRQDWCLVDHDPVLLAMARRILSTWACVPQADGEHLAFERSGKALTVSFAYADLRTDIERLIAQRPGLVTAAALFDLVSCEWIDRFADALTGARLPLYAVLTYTGNARWEPGHPIDARINSAFNEHQTRSKGFGPAAGPQAARHLAAALRARGYAVDIEDSPWLLTVDDNRLIQSLAHRIVQAVGETDLVPAEILAAWRGAHTHPVRCEISHVDIFARPL